MLFLTQKKLDQRIAEAVKAVMVTPDREPEIQALREQVAQLKADLHERVAGTEYDLVRRLTEQNEVHNAGVQGLMRQMEDVRVSIPAMPAPDERIPAQAREIRELADTVQYLLDAPDTTPTVINNYPVTPEPQVWVRRMGAA